MQHTRKFRPGLVIQTLLLAGILSLIVTPSLAQAKRYMVTFKSESTFKALQAQWGNELQTHNSSFELFGAKTKVDQLMGNVQILVIEADDERDVDGLRNHPAVESVEAEQFIPAPQPIATFSDSSIEAPSTSEKMETPWGIHAVKAPEAWAKAGAGFGTRVLVLDTGLDHDHQDLISRFEQGRDFVGDNRSNIPYAYFDTNGHGTHVAGTVLADGKNSGLVGVAPDAKLLAGRVCGDRGCSTVAIINGVDWGIEQKVDVISMSLGGPFISNAARKAYERAEAADVVVVAASGNSGSSRVSYPAALASTVAVGAIDNTLTKADFSQYGPELDVVAPGVDVVSAAPRGTGRDIQVMVNLGKGAVELESAPLQGSALGAISGAPMVFAGLGKAEDFANLDLTNKVALISRGEIAFAEKVGNAEAAGAVAVLIFNNEPGMFRGTLGDSPANVPAASLSLEDGETLRDHIEAGKQATAAVDAYASDFASMQGTSMATPHVSGVVALIRAANPNLNAAEVRNILKTTATPLEPNSNNEYGSGLVNAEAAVNAALEQSLFRVAN